MIPYSAGNVRIPCAQSNVGMIQFNRPNIVQKKAVRNQESAPVASITSPVIQPLNDTITSSQAHNLASQETNLQADVHAERNQTPSDSIREAGSLEALTNKKDKPNELDSNANQSGMASDRYGESVESLTPRSSTARRVYIYQNLPEQPTPNGNSRSPANLPSPLQESAIQSDETLSATSSSNNRTGLKLIIQRKRALTLHLDPAPWRRKEKRRKQGKYKPRTVKCSECSQSVSFVKASLFTHTNTK